MRRAAMIAGRLDLVERRRSARPSWSAAAMPSLSKHRLVGPHPVGRMHVDRGGDPLAVVLREFLQRRRHDLVPAFLARRRRSGRRPRPACAQSVMSKPSICTAVGGLPAVTRARSTVIACSPPPPATGMSFQVMPLASEVLLQHVERRRLAARGPPVQHLDLLRAAALTMPPSIRAAASIMYLRMSVSSLFRLDSRLLRAGGGLPSRLVAAPGYGARDGSHSRQIAQACQWFCGDIRHSLPSRA